MFCMSWVQWAEYCNFSYVKPDAPGTACILCVRGVQEKIVKYLTCERVCVCVCAAEQLFSVRMAFRNPLKTFEDNKHKIAEPYATKNG